VCISIAGLLLGPAAQAQESVTEKASKREQVQTKSLQPPSSVVPPAKQVRGRERAATGRTRLSAELQSKASVEEDRAELIDLIRRAAAETGVQEIQQGLAEAMLGGSTQFRVMVISVRSGGMVRVTGPGGLDRQLSGVQLQQVLGGNTSPLGIRLIDVLGDREINPSVFAQQLLNML
jgi:TPR repeat protein